MAPATKTFPSISTLVNESIADTKVVFWRIFRWSLLSSLIVSVPLLVSIVLTAGALVSSAEVMTGLSIAPSLQPILGVAAVISFLLAVPLLMVPQLGTLLLAQRKAPRYTFGALFKKSWRKAFPTLLSGLLILPFLGAFFLLILPLYLLMLWVSFATMALVLSNLSPWAAIRRSIAIWQTYGNQLFLRMLIPMVLSSFTQQLSQILIRTGNLSVVVLGVILNVILGVVLATWSVVYLVRLFETADQLTPVKKQPNMKIVWGLSLGGWLVGIGILVAILGPWAA